MAGLALDASNPDVSLLHDINGLAQGAPRLVDRGMEFVGAYGIIAGCVLLTLWAWWTARRRADHAPTAVAEVLWAPLAAGLALLANVPIRGFVQRPRPFTDHRDVDVLAGGVHGYSFVNDQAAWTMAVGVGLFVASRRFGRIGIGLALLEGFCQIYAGVAYPTDVIGGYALGTAVVLLFAPLAMMALTPLMTAAARSRVGSLVRAPLPDAVPGGLADDGLTGCDEPFDESETRSPDEQRGNKDLAA